jgi:hypothetical protein
VVAVAQADAGRAVLAWGLLLALGLGCLCLAWRLAGACGRACVAGVRRLRRALCPRLSRRKRKKLDLADFARAQPPKDCVAQWRIG